MADREALLRSFIDEDLGAGDPTSELLSEAQVSGRVVSRQNGIVAGTRHARYIFSTLGCRCDIMVHDGRKIGAGEVVLKVSGRATDVLALERTALNLLSRMSGIATAAAGLAAALPDGVRLQATRKTAPGLRMFDKEAVEAGGGLVHRFNLGDMILIKDNHIAAEGSMEKLIARARERGGRFEVEVDTPSAALVAAREGAPIILLDNFEPKDIRYTVGMLRQAGLREDVVLEASGGITASNIAEYGASGVDCVSVGSMTNSAPVLDMGLDLV